MPKPKNSMRLDPTRTTMLRRGLMTEMRKRFRALRAAITRLIVDEDAFGLRADRQAGSNAVLAAPTATSQTLGLEAVLNTSSLVLNVVRRVGRLWYVYSEKGKRLSRGYPTKKQAAKRLGQIEYFKRNEGGNGTLTINTRWRFETDAAKVEGYQTWLKGQVDAGILEVSPDNLQTPWMEKYIKSSYKTGLMRAYTDTHAAGIAAAAPDFAFMEGGKAGFLKMAFDSPIAEGKMKLLSTRSFSQLKGVTAQMDQEMSRILADGIAAGKGPRELARQLTKSVSGLEKKRALAIARTEIIHAHAEGQLDAFEAMNVEEVGVQAEWSTASDDRVCPTCQPLEGIVLSVKEARGMIPRHPNAVFADSLFTSYGECQQLVRARYSGPAVELVTAGDHRTTIGPNHPIMTRRGMVAAAQIQKGDKVLYDLRVDGFGGTGRQPPHINNEKVFTIQDVFQTCVARGGNSSIATTGHDFHGDSVSCYGEIEIIAPTWRLLPVFDPCGIQHLRERDFMRTYPEAECMAGLSPCAAHGERVFLPSPGGVGGSAAWVLADPRFVWLDVHCVSFTTYEGWAYDGSTASSLYCSDGFVVSNCRCAWIPAGVGEHIGGTTTTKHAGPGQGLAPPGTLPTGKTTGQSWNPATVSGRIRDSIKAEHPKLGPKDARAASRWTGADLTKVSQKLKPGSKAYQAAVGAKKQMAAKALAVGKAKSKARAAIAKKARMVSKTQVPIDLEEIE